MGLYALPYLKNQRGDMRNLFITGGAGYLGRALLRTLVKEWPDINCTIFSRDHGKHSYCQREFPQFRYLIGDVRDYDSVEMAMAGHDTVVHAAAFKYVPEAEINVRECHEINVIGSLNVAMAAMRLGVERVVGLSTDKACQPINVYGMTKSLMERIFQDYDSKCATQFNLVRYGNVVSSTGSAIPIFRRQARETGVVKLTNPDMTRFWLSVNDAVGLILLALIEDEGGTILIPRLPSLSLIETAYAAVEMELGKEGNVTHEVIGKRFGEKEHEDLLGEIESPYAEMMEDNVMRLYPMTSKPVGKLKRYNSFRPDNILTTHEFIKMIQEAPE